MYLPEIYAKYSENYVSGQKMTENTIDYLYSAEMKDCMRLNSYMGLWQLAQVASALNVPIMSVYPEGGDELMRLVFNRTFYPINTDTSEDPIIIMWTGGMKGSVPNHFVPLIPKRKRNKYANFEVHINLVVCFHFRLQFIYVLFCFRIK